MRSALINLPAQSGGPLSCRARALRAAILCRDETLIVGKFDEFWFTLNPIIWLICLAAAPYSVDVVGHGVIEQHNPRLRRRRCRGRRFFIIVVIARRVRG